MSRLRITTEEVVMTSIRRRVVAVAMATLALLVKNNLSFISAKVVAEPHLTSTREFSNSIR